MNKFLLFLLAVSFTTILSAEPNRKLIAKSDFDIWGAGDYCQYVYEDVCTGEKIVKYAPCNEIAKNENTVSTRSKEELCAHISLSSYFIIPMIIFMGVMGFCMMQTSKRIPEGN